MGFASVGLPRSLFTITTITLFQLSILLTTTITTEFPWVIPITGQAFIRPTPPPMGAMLIPGHIIILAIGQAMGSGFIATPVFTRVLPCKKLDRPRPWTGLFLLLGECWNEKFFYFYFFCVPEFDGLLAR